MSEVVECVRNASTCVFGNMTVSCQEVQQDKTISEHVTSYFIGIGTIGILLFIYQILYYLKLVYGWWVTNDHMIKLRLLPLQIYMRDMDKIIDSIDDSQPLKERQKQYNEFIEASRYCWIKKNNPKYGKKKRKCVCFREQLVPKFTYELCEYERRDENIYIKRNTHTLPKYMRWILTFGCSGCRKQGKDLLVSEKNVFLGRYRPYLANEMQIVDLDKGLVAERVKVNGVDDSFLRFFCGYFKSASLQDLEIAVQAELNEENIKRNMKIKF